MLLGVDGFQVVVDVTVHLEDVCDVLLTFGGIKQDIKKDEFKKFKL